MRWLGKGRLSSLRGQRGFSLIEVLVAAAILAVIGVGLLNALDTNAKATRTLDEKVVATNLATAYFEAIKALPPDDLQYPWPTCPSPEDVITIPPQYGVNVGIQFPSDIYVGEDDITYFTWDNIYNGETLQKIAVTVSREGGRHILTICTFRADF